MGIWGLGWLAGGVSCCFGSYFFMLFTEFVLGSGSSTLSLLPLISSISVRPFDPDRSFSLSAYLRVFRLWSAEELPGDMHAIMSTLHFLLINESLRTRVNLDALNGTWSALSSIARIHSLSANKLNRFPCTSYWFLLLKYASVCCCFEYPVLSNFQQDQLKRVSPLHSLLLL